MGTVLYDAQLTTSTIWTCLRHCNCMVKDDRPSEDPGLVSACEMVHRPGTPPLLSGDIATNPGLKMAKVLRPLLSCIFLDFPELYQPVRSPIVLIVNPGTSSLVAATNSTRRHILDPFRLRIGTLHVKKMCWVGRIVDVQL